MYHAPVALDVDPPEEQAVLALDDNVGPEASSIRLRDAHLHNGQAHMRALFAPYFAISGVGAALLVAWAMYGSVRLELIGGWIALVGVCNWTVYRRSLQEGAAAGSRSAEGRSIVRAVGEAAGLAAVWASLPAYVFATQSDEAQAVIGGAMAAMIIAAIALAAVPAAAMAWIATLTGALCLAYYFGSASLSLKMGLTLIGVASVAVAGMARLTRWSYAQLETIAKVRAQAEAVRLLLKEYEHRGVGWLWQVDAENRVVYISSRMTSLLGRSAGQLIGHSLPASLGGNSALGRTLLSRQPFASLEMELKTRRGMRWISLAGDPIIDMSGQFQGFRGVGSDVTEVRKTQERLTNLAIWTCFRACPIAAASASCLAKRCPARSRAMCPARSCSSTSTASSRSTTRSATPRATRC